MQAPFWTVHVASASLCSDFPACKEDGKFRYYTLVEKDAKYWNEISWVPLKAFLLKTLGEMRLLCSMFVGAPHPL